MDPKQVAKLLADEYSVKILTATYKVPRSANYLSMKFDIPIAGCYRRIKNLEKMGLLDPAEKVFTKFGKWVWVYRSNLKYVNLVLQEGEMKVFFQLTDQSCTEHHETWSVLEQKLNA
jgi:hypothetical protein